MLEVADVGCGHGASTIVMARAFPKSHFTGFDYHPGSIEHARGAAAKAGVADRVSFEVAKAKDYPGQGLRSRRLSSIACTIWAIRREQHRMCRRPLPLMALGWSSSRWRRTTWRRNFNPVGRIYYGASTMICTPASMAQEVGTALGAQAGESALTEVIGGGVLGTSAWRRRHHSTWFSRLGRKQACTSARRPCPLRLGRLCELQRRSEVGATSMSLPTHTRENAALHREILSFYF